MTFWSVREKRLLVFAAIIVLLLLSSWLYFWFGEDEDHPPPLPADASIDMNLNEGALQVQTGQGSEAAGEESGKEDVDSATQAPPEIVIDVKGAVKRPGIVRMEEGQRVFQALKKAGGLKERADASKVNKAERLRDGMVYYIPEKGETVPERFQNNGPDSTQGTKTTRVRINTASEKQLQQLTGIGPAKARSIVRYRDEHGAFQQVEDVMKVSGIGEKTLAKFKDRITVD